MGWLDLHHVLGIDTLFPELGLPERKAFTTEARGTPRKVKVKSWTGRMLDLYSLFRLFLVRELCFSPW